MSRSDDRAGHMTHSSSRPTPLGVRVAVSWRPGPVGSLDVYNGEAIGVQLIR